jgi:hypothetical protein
MRRAAMGAGQGNVSQTRSSSLPTGVKDVMARADEATTWGEMVEALLIMGIMTFLLLV